MRIMRNVIKVYSNNLMFTFTVFPSIDVGLVALRFNPTVGGGNSDKHPYS